MSKVQKLKDCDKYVLNSIKPALIVWTKFKPLLSGLVRQAGKFFEDEFTVKLASWNCAFNPYKFKIKLYTSADFFFCYILSLWKGICHHSLLIYQRGIFIMLNSNKWVPLLSTLNSNKELQLLSLLAATPVSTEH